MGPFYHLGIFYLQVKLQQCMVITMICMEIVCNVLVHRFKCRIQKHWAGLCLIDNLSFLSGPFTTLNDVNQKNFLFVGSLNSDAPTKINNVST